MKKRILTVFTVLCSMTALMAQDQKKPIEFNRWSVDLNGGFSKSIAPYDAGYYGKTFYLNYGDLGVRYMLNNKFGFKVDYGYNHFQPGSESLHFDTKYYRTDLQTHIGAGYSWLTSDSFSSQDNIVNAILGLTGQIRLGHRIALNADFSMVKNALQNNTFNGTPASSALRGFEGTIYTASAGISVYLGKHTQHADWYSSNLELENAKKIDSLDSKIKEIETMLNDTDRDGVADYLDQEPNTTAGLTVDTHGRAVDQNNNGVPDELEKYMDKTYATKSEVKPVAVGQESVAELMNGEYINAYFDLNSTTPTKDSYAEINYIVKYLKANPSAKVELNGYADETGDVEYNKALSAKRGDSVKNILIKSGITADRITVVGNGIDNSVDKKSKDARRMVRRVSFKVTN